LASSNDLNSIADAMLFSPSKKLLFIHVYKTGGVSIAHALRSHLSRTEVRYQKFCRRLDESGILRLRQLRQFNMHEHSTALELQQVIAPDMFRKCFKFAFVRNPWALQLSLYRYVLRTPEHFQHALFAGFADFEAYIEWIGARPNGDHKIQRDFLVDAEGQMLVDFIGRFEHLHADYASVAERFGWTAELPHFNKSDGDPDFRKFYSPRTRDIVAGLHRADIESFGYDF
jgi:hypothetical protein